MFCILYHMCTHKLILIIFYLFIIGLQYFNMTAGQVCQPNMQVVQLAICVDMYWQSEQERGRKREHCDHFC